MSLCDIRKAMKMGATNVEKRSLKTKHLAPIFRAELRTSMSRDAAAAGSRPLHEQNERHDGDEQGRQQPERRVEREHRRLALDHAKLGGEGASGGGHEVRAAR